MEAKDVAMETKKSKITRDSDQDISEKVHYKKKGILQWKISLQ